MTHELAWTFIAMRIRHLVAGRQTIAKRIRVVERMAKEAYTEAVAAGETNDAASVRAVTAAHSEVSRLRTAADG